MFSLGKFVGALVVVGAVASGANVAQAQRYNWTGLYFGGGAGYASGDGLTDMSVSGTFIQRAAPDLDGAIWGGHVGLNYQMGAWVVGAEAQWLSGLDGSKLAPAFLPPFDTLLINGTVDVDSFQLFKGRVGYAWDRWLAYVTGGYATGQITSRFQDFNFNGGIPVVTDKQRHGGWVLGVGVDYALTQNLILGVEYLHIDLENKIHAGFNNFGGGVPERNHRVNADADVIMARLSFKIGGEHEYAPMK